MLIVANVPDEKVLKQSAMRGRCKKPPLDEKEAMELAKALLLRKGDLQC